MRSPIKIHTDLRKPVSHETKCIDVCLMDGTILHSCRKIKLTGTWILRQYSNPVPCGATVVLFTEDETSTYEVLK